MRSKSFTGPFFSETDELGEKINGWLKHLDGEIVIDNVISNVTDGYQKVIIFYSDKPAVVTAPAKTTWTPAAVPRETVCKQCKKNPSIPGLKMCEACREYQKQYRESRKAEKRARYP